MQKQKQKKVRKISNTILAFNNQQQTLGKRKTDLQSFHIIIFKCPFSITATNCKETGKYDLLTGNKKTKAIPQKDDTSDLLDKDFKSTVSNMLKELKETRKMMYEQKNIQEEK